MHADSDSEELVSGINVTPLVDITLVLLIVFMVTAKLVSSSGVPVDLPKASTGGSTQTVLAVSLDARGDITIDGRPAKSADVARRAREARAREPDVRAVVQADRAVSHGAVVQVIDALREGGVSRLAFAVQPATRAP